MESAICEKTFAAEEPFFRGHFPGDPLVPGVILSEALAQTAGIAAGGAGRGFRLTAIKGMKFFQAARPGDLLILTARKIAAVGGLWRFEVSARVGEDKVADGVIVLSETPGALFTPSLPAGLVRWVRIAGRRWPRNPRTATRRADCFKGWVG